MYRNLKLEKKRLGLVWISMLKSYWFEKGTHGALILGDLNLFLLDQVCYLEYSEVLLLLVPGAFV